MLNGPWKTGDGWEIRRDMEIPFKNEIKRLLDESDDWVEETYDIFNKNNEHFVNLVPLPRSSSKATDNGDKTFDLDESFVFWCLIRKYKLKNILELGTRFGVSTRMMRAAQFTFFPESQTRLYSCDLNEEHRYMHADDFDFIHGDATLLFPHFLEENQIDCLHNDAHPYDLTKLSTQAAIDNETKIMTYHDVSRPEDHSRAHYKKDSFFLTEEEKMKNSTNLAEHGHWERHVVCEMFSKELLENNFVETDQYKIQMFCSLFGLGVVVRKGAVE